MADESNPHQFTVQLGKMALTDEQINTIQNEIAKVVAENVRKMATTPELKSFFGQFGSFGSFRSFGQRI